MDRQGFERKIYLLWGKISMIWRKLNKNNFLSILVDSFYHFIIAVVLTGGVIADSFATFGVSFVAAGCARGKAFPSAVGAFFGYIILMEEVNGLGYGGAVLITMAIYYIFNELPLVRTRWFMPLAAAVANGVTSFVFWTFNSPADIMMFMCSIVVTFGTAYFYILAFEKSKNSLTKASGCMVFGGTLLISLHNIMIFGIIAVSRIIAVLVTMAVSYMGGYTGGAAMGVAMGITMDSTSGESIFFSCVYGFAALIAGVFNKTGKTVFVCSYVIANATASLLAIDNSLYLSGLYESFIASVLFIIIPCSFWTWAKEYISPSVGETSDYVNKIRKTARHYAMEASQAFYEMYLSMLNGVEKSKAHNDEDIASIYDDAAEKVCRKCKIRNICWEKDYISTLNAFNDASVTMMREGKVTEKDFPNHFVARCVRFPELLTSINEGITALLSRRKFKERVQENKTLIAQQYMGITGILKQLGLMMGTGFEFLPAKEEQLRSYSEAFGDVKTVVAYRDQFGRVRLEISGDAIDNILKEKEGFIAGLSALMGIPLSVPQKITDEIGSRVYIKELEPFGAVVGVGIKKKEDVCGDNGTYFATESGKAYMILSDGMGTGEEAGDDSKTAVKMIERFLKAGFTPEDALKTVSPALKIRSSELSFVTIDIVEINLITGMCQIFKCGSAPTYVKCGTHIKKIPCTTLPTGILYGDDGQDIVRMSLKDGDIITLVSDGISDGENDDWLMDVLSKEHNLSAKELAAKIIVSSENKQNRDDMTAMVLKLRAQ